MNDSNKDKPPQIESHWLKVGNDNVQYRKAGCGPAVVLLHGGASDSRDWVSTMSALARQYCLYVPDLIGFGESERNKAGYYVSDFIDSVLGFLKQLNLTKTVMVGHSFGGRVCLGVALRQPDMVKKLVLVNTAGICQVSRWANLVGTTFWALRKFVGRPQPYPDFLSGNNEKEHWLCTDELTGIKIPTLIIWKRYDPYFPLGAGRRALDLIPGARLEVIPGYGHAPHKQNGRAFNRILTNFLKGD